MINTVHASARAPVLCLHKRQSESRQTQGAPAHEQRSGGSRSKHVSAALRMARVNCVKNSRVCKRAPALCLHKRQGESRQTQGAPAHEQRSGGSRSKHVSAALRMARVNCVKNSRVCKRAPALCLHRRQSESQQTQGAPAHEQRSGGSRNKHVSAALRMARVNV